MRVRSQWEIVEIPGLSHGIYPEEHVWNKLGSLTEKSCTTSMCPSIACIGVPLGPSAAYSASPPQVPRRMSISMAPSTQSSIHQATPNISENSAESSKAHRRAAESCTNLSSARPHRPIIDGSLKGLE
jgi:hypothetical protein